MMPKHYIKLAKANQFETASVWGIIQYSGWWTTHGLPGAVSQIVRYGQFPEFNEYQWLDDWSGLRNIFLDI